MEPESWRPVPRYEGWYEVSSLGNITSLARRGTLGGPVAASLNSRGYRVVTLSKYGRRKTLLVGRLVLEAYRGPARGQRAVHGRGGPADDRLANLHWG